MKAPIPETEAARLAALSESGILDTPPEEAYEDLVRLAAHVCGAPIAAVSLVASDRQWFKAILGLDARETPRDAAFCAHTILQPDVFVVPDAQADARFADNPLVTGEPNIRFYAGAPLLTPEGHALGSLCIIDRIPRRLTPDQAAALGALARQAAGQIELGRRVAAQERLIAEREQSAALFHSAIESMQEGFVLQDRAGVIHRCNPRAEEILGLTAGQLMGRTSLDPAWRTVRADGSGFPGLEHPAMASLRDGVPRNGVVMGIHKPGGVLTWVSINTTPLWEAGEAGPSGVVCTFTDITAVRQAEQERERLAAIVEFSYDAILGTTLDGTLVSWNAGAERLYGYAASEVIGRHASVLAPDEERGFTGDVIRAVLSGDRRENVEVRRRRKNGDWVDVSMTFSAIRSLGGEITGVAAIGRDITAQAEARKAIRRSETRLAEAQQLAHVGSWELDLTSQEVQWSQEMYRLFEFDPADGPPTFESVRARYHPDDLARRDKFCEAALAEGTPYVLDMRLTLPGGGTRWCQVRGRVERDEAARPVRLVGTVMDVSERAQAEEALRQSAAHLRAVVGGASVILFGLDRDGVFTLSEGKGLEALGLSPGEAVGASIFDLFGDGDPIIPPQIRRALEGEAVSYTSEMGGHVWQNRCTPLLGGDGSLQGLIGVSHDVTEVRQTEAALRRSRERLEQAQAIAHVGSWETDCRTGARYWSPEMFRLFGLPPAPDAPSRDEFLALIHPEDRATLLTNLGEIFAHGTPQNWEHRILCPGGEVRHIQAVLEPVRDASGVLIAVQGTGMDITERKMAEQTLKDFSVVLEFQKAELEATNAELERLATTDGLTGLHNRRAFDGRLREEFERATRYGTSLSLLMLDIDHFKEYNDAFGHPEGDEVLRRIGRVLEKATRETDYLARYGGEELAVVLPETDGDGAMTVAERIRLAVATAGWDKREVTASVGVTTLRLGMDRAEEMIACADRALYRSKAAGRNRVTHGRNVGHPVGV